MTKCLQQVIAGFYILSIKQKRQKTFKNKQKVNKQQLTNRKKRTKTCNLQKTPDINIFKGRSMCLSGVLNLSWNLHKSILDSWLAESVTLFSI